MAQELTFNISEDRRKLQGPVEAKNFNLKFGTDGVAITHGNPKQWVQGRIGDNELKQVFVNITEGENNTPKDVAGLFLAFVGIIHDKDGRPHRVVDYKHSTTIDVEHGRFRFDFPDQAFTVAGEYQQAFFMLVKEGPGGGCVATMEFDMQVMANFVFTDLVPEDYITPFNDTVDQLLAACKKFKDDTAADEAKFKQELEDAYAKFQKDTNTQFNNFKDATDDDLAKFKKANADDIAKFKQQYADAVQAKEDELQSKVDSYTDKIDTMLKDLNQQGIDTTTLLTTLQANIKTLEEEINQDNIVTKPQLDALEQTIQKQLTDSLTQLNGRLTNVEGNLEPYSVEQADFNGKDVMHRGHLAVHKKTYGRYQNAAGMSVMVNGDDKAKIEGNSLEFIAKHYNGRDSAGLYVENSRIPYLLQTTDTKFTATSVTVIDGSVDLSNVKPGMLIDTSKRANIDKDWYVTAVKSVDGRTINTELWYKVQSDPNAETVTGTPADGLAITVNPTVGIWGINSNIYLPQEDAESGSAMELGVYSASKVPQDVVGLRVTSGQEDINDGVHVTGNVHQAYNAANRDGGTAYNVAPGAKVDYYFRAQNADTTTNYFINSQGQVMHETLVPHFTGTFKDLDYGKDTSLLIINSEGDQTITLDYGRYGRIIHIVTTGTGVKTIVANPASSSATPGASWFLSPDTKQGNASEIKLNREAGKPSVNLVDLGNLFAVL